MASIGKVKLAVSADAAARLRQARDWIQHHGAAAELVIVAPSNEAVRDICLESLGVSGASFGTRRLTFNGLASRLAQQSLATAGLAPANTLLFRGIVARSIHMLNAHSKLSYFEPVAVKPGFPLAVAQTLEELRMNDVTPDALEQLGRGGRDLAAIARAVRDELAEAQLADRTTIFEHALTAISAGSKSDYVGLPLLLLDLPVRSELEVRLITALALKAPDVMVTSPAGDDQTISLMEQRLECAREIVTHEPTESSLSLLKQHLFEVTAPEHAALDDTVILQNWPGEPRECIEIVRSIQSEAGRGLAFDQIAIFLNSTGEYRAHLEEAFGRAGIPAYFAKGSTAPDPAGRALLALLQCAADGLSAKRFAEYLSLGQVPDPETARDEESNWKGPDDDLLLPLIELVEESPGESDDPQLLLEAPEEQRVIEGSLRTPSRWEQLLVDSAVIGGIDRWRRRLKGLENELRLRLQEIQPEQESQIESVKRQLKDLDSLRTFALPLVAQLSKLPDKANWAHWLRSLKELALNSLRQPEGVLETLAELEPMSPVGPVDLYEVQLVLGPKLRDLALRPRQRRYGAVFIGPVELARGMSFPVVFVPGLAERVFPQKLVEDPILPDDLKNELGPGTLTRRGDLLERERLGLRLAVGAATARIYLSYPRIDVQQSRPRVPSFYALEALRAAEGVLPGLEDITSRAESRTRARLGWPAPENPTQAIDEAEYDLALLANLLEQEKQQAIGSAHYLLTANVHLARALRARSRRWLRRWTQNDGLVDIDELARESMKGQQFSTRSFSATALQNFSSCPYRFFLNAILRLELRQEPSAIEVIDPLTRGSLFHETQFEVLTALKERGMLPLTNSRLETAFDLVNESLDHLSAELEDQLNPAIPRVWSDGINSIRADLREWLRRSSESHDGWVPDKFELSFGLADRGPRNSDPASVKDPVEVVGDLKLRGSIDLVEQRANGTFRVTDHKTGKARAEKRTVVGGGKHLQPLLYALACDKLLSVRVEAGRLYYCTADGGFEERVVHLNPENIRLINQVLIAIRESLADGFLPAAPEEDACMWCDFLAVCGSHEELRTRSKPRDRIQKLKEIRELP